MAFHPKLLPDDIYGQECRVLVDRARRELPSKGLSYESLGENDDSSKRAIIP